MLFYQSLLALFAVLVVVSAVRKGRGGARKRTLPSDDSIDVSEIPEEERTLDQWLSLDLGVLRLACMNNHLLQSGSREHLVSRLMSFFHPATSHSQPVQNISSGVEVQTQPLSITISPPVAPTITHSIAPVVNSIQPVMDSLGPLIAAEINRYMNTNFRQAEGNSVNRDANVNPSSNSNIVSTNAGQSSSSMSRPSQCCSHAAINPGMHSTASNVVASVSGSSMAAGEVPAGFLGQAFASPGLPSGSNSAFALPAVGKPAMEKIKNNDYIVLDTLLPNFAPVLHDEMSFQVQANQGSDTSLKLVPKTQSRPKISDFTSWSVAWSNFMRVYVHFFPHRVMELVQYHAIISDFASQFCFSAWLQYERSFRFRMAQNPALSWARVDEELYNRYLRHSTLQHLCFHCRNFGHYASACPLRAGSSGQSPFRAPQRSAGNSNGAPVSSHTQSSPSQPPPQRRSSTGGAAARPNSRDPCYYFNRDGCNSDECRFEHVCHVCFGNHPASRCSRRFSSR